MKKKILIFGGSGLLGSNFIFFLQKKYKFIFNYTNKKIFFENIKYVKIFNDIKNLNFTDINKKIKKIKPDIVFNCLALTNIDECERNIEESYSINYLFVETLSKICKNNKIKFIHISTDQLYSKNNKFKNETFETNPTNVYGQHKLISEKACLENNSQALVIRTNFFGYSLYHKKLTDIILLNKNNINLLNDYFYTPIYVGLLCEIIDKLIKKNAKGLFNIVGNDRVSKNDFGMLLVKYAKLNKNLIKSVSINKKNVLFAKRTQDLSLSNKKIKKYLKIKMPNIDEQIKLFTKDFTTLKNFFENTIPYGKHSIDNSDIESVKKTLLSKSLTQGYKILETEKYIAKYVGAKYAVAVSSATAGLHISYLAAGIGPKKNIITSPISFVSTSNAAYYCNSNVYFSDIDKFTLNLCPKSLYKNLFNKNIHAIVPVHFAGLAADMKKIFKLAKKNNLRVIEDAAHAMGAKYNCGSMVGSCKYADMTVFSFHPVKIVAGGEGGIITTNCEKLYNKLLELRSHGINKDDYFIKNKKNGYTNNKKNPWYYEMLCLGMHYRQTDIHCALILSQMQRINKFLNKRKQIAKNYDFFFKKNSKIKCYQSQYRLVSSNHLYVVSINFDKININRAEFMMKLKDYGIISQVHYIPIPMQPYYCEKGFNMKKLPNALNYYENCLSIPIYFDLSASQQKYVEDSINEIIKFYS